MSGSASLAFDQGTIVAGKYRIERILASGGQGTVALATHLRLHQPVALKVGHVSEEVGGDALERIFREARATFRLTSEHIARIIDVDVAHGMPFIVMEYLEGHDLKALLAARGPLPYTEAVGLLMHAIDGVAEAHDVGIIHRDLKPSNLFVQERSDGTPLLKVLDFGVSKATSLAALGPEEVDLTAPLRVLGTPRYMAPEQACDARAASVASDIWALGLILQEMLTGTPVFRARNEVEVLAQIIHKSPTPVSLLRPEVPGEIERILLRCLQKVPENRFADVRELAEQLAPFVPSWATVELARLRRAPRARRPSPAETPAEPRPAPARSKARAALGALAVVVLAGGSTMLVARWLQGGHAPRAVAASARQAAVAPLSPLVEALAPPRASPIPPAPAPEPPRPAAVEAAPTEAEGSSAPIAVAAPRRVRSVLGEEAHPAASVLRRSPSAASRKLGAHRTRRSDATASTDARPAVPSPASAAAPSLAFDPLDGRK